MMVRCTEKKIGGEKGLVRNQVLNSIHRQVLQKVRTGFI